MMDKTPTNTRLVPVGVTAKVVYTVVAVLLLIIGLAGILVPIIPGVLFLIGAVLILSKASKRVHRWSEGQPWVRGARIRMIQMQGLHPAAKVRFVGLLVAQSVVSGVERLGQFRARLFSKR
jgi:uncharacterized membrane protein YbaN (DUF454 family)